MLWVISFPVPFSRKTIFSLAFSLLPIYIPGRCLNRPKSALLKSRVVVLLFALFPPLRVLNSSISESLQPRLPLTFLFLIRRILPCLQVSGPAEYLLPSTQKVINKLQKPPGSYKPCCVVPSAVLERLKTGILLCGSSSHFQKQVFSFFLPEQEIWNRYPSWCCQCWFAV